MDQLSHPHMLTEKNMALTIWTFVGKVMSLLYNTLSSFVIAFIPRSKSFNFMAAVTIYSDWYWNPRRENLSVFPLCHFLFAMKWCDQKSWSQYFEYWVLSQLIQLSTFTLMKRLFFIIIIIVLCFLLLEWYHLHIWVCWCFPGKLESSLWVIHSHISHDVLHIEVK